jgi:hypothetical protein
MRRDGWNAGRLALWLDLRGDGAWHRSHGLADVHDDQAILSALELLWNEARESLPPRARVLRLGVTLFELTRANERQLDLLLNDDVARRRSEARRTRSTRSIGRRRQSRTPITQIIRSSIVTLGGSLVLMELRA